MQQKSRFPTIQIHNYQSSNTNLILLLVILFTCNLSFSFGMRSVASRTHPCVQQFRFDTSGILSFVLICKTQYSRFKLQHPRREIVSRPLLLVSKVTLVPPDAMFWLYLNFLRTCLDSIFRTLWSASFFHLSFLLSKCNKLSMCEVPHILRKGKKLNIYCRNLQDRNAIPKVYLQLLII